ncbi:df446dcb-37ea-4449-9041-195606bb0711 [Sclerotinia trifoliorum]|uniref:Df446dcb-37ea-4449-9041-195606bb0711 n=1 Tax=Sclerotinia trifoliorum TaxID=28548 RepID=A0A8H2ZPV3_9HELO|nr:df446dcb-37ea-4449-9041-195606bb0711 [Sclerotinia trifoliorum]
MTERKIFKMLHTVFLLLSICSSYALASLQIISGATWTASGINQHIQAHGGGIIQVGSTYYWAGENKLNGSAFQSINCYSSTDLVNWKFNSYLLTLQSSGDLGPNRVVERPHIMYNDATAKYVLWMHIDSSNYGEAKAGVATSDSVCGPYTYLGASQPLGYQSRDLNVFKDTDGTGYLLTEDRANGLRIDKLSANYTSVVSAVYLFADYEAPAIYKSDDTYFMFASHLSGWSPNDNVYATATNLSGPWSAWSNFATVGTNTYSSQTAAVVNINGVVMYMGDRWESSNLMTSTYVWLPLTISGTKASMSNEVNWIIDPAAGTWTTGPSEAWLEADAATNTLANGAKNITCSGCSDGVRVGYIGGPSPGGTLTMDGVSSSVATTTTIRIHHLNGDSTQRYAKVVVNGVSNIIAFLPTADGNTPGTSVLTTPLKSGAGNSIEFESYNSGWAPDIDRIMIPVS